MKISDANGNRWHRLSEIEQGGKPLELMAATCFDGIACFVLWCRRQDGGYDVSALDSEGQKWESVDFSEESNEIPREPPTIWDDLLFSPLLSPQRLEHLLLKHGLIHSAAVEDPEGYDNYATHGAIIAVHREILEGLAGYADEGVRAPVSQPLPTIANDGEAIPQPSPTSSDEGGSSGV